MQADEVVDSLLAPGARISLADRSSLPRTPGMYAIFGLDAGTLDDLGLGFDPDRRPLYVGIAAKRGLSVRVKEHMATRGDLVSSLLGFLSELLMLQGVIPRPLNLMIPGFSEPYAEIQAQWSDYCRNALLSWAEANLTISWVDMSPPELVAIEPSVIRYLCPALNQVHNGSRRDFFKRMAPHNASASALENREITLQIVDVLNASRNEIAGLVDGKQLRFRPARDSADQSAQWFEARVDDELFEPGDGWIIAANGSELSDAARESTLDQAKPLHLWHWPCRSAYGRPPDWELLVGSLTEMDQRMLIATHYAEIAAIFIAAANEDHTAERE